MITTNENNVWLIPSFCSNHNLISKHLVEMQSQHTDYKN